jgi:hypothetical protein
LQAETILPLSLILLESISSNRKDKGFGSWDKDSYTGSWLALLSCTCVLPSKLILLELTFSVVPGPLLLTLVTLKYLR